MPETKLVRHVGFEHPILINVEDFDPAVHSALDPVTTAKEPKGAKGAKKDEK